MALAHSLARLAVASAAFLPAGSLIANATAQPATAKATKTTSAASPSPTIGLPTTLTATVAPAPTSGTVGFTVSAKALTGCTKVAVKAGKASCTTTFTTAGARKVKAAYSGTTTYGGVQRSDHGYGQGRSEGQLIGGVGTCTTSGGALVAVSFGPWNGPIVRGCDPAPTTGIKLLTTAGTDIGGTTGQPTFTPNQIRNGLPA